jgi:hypothetical protein
MRSRTLWLLSVLATAVVVGVALLVGSTRAEHPAAAPRTAVVTAASPTTRAVAVLLSWDRRRAAAWARDDADALRSLYVGGSSTGRRDIAMLTAYHRRGLRVTTMLRQVLAVRVRTSEPRALSLLVTDRLVEGRVTGHGERLVLPRSRPATHRIVLRRAATGWRVAEVYDD